MTVMLAEPHLVEIRSGDGYQVADVNYPKRLVTVVAMPYERASRIYEPDRSYDEIVSRGAFSGIEKRSGKVRVNRDHSWEKPVGKIVALHPSRKEGLVSEVKISATVLGDETLALCDDDVLSASAGFTLLQRDDGSVYDDAETWERNGSLRRLNRVWLDHLAFVPNPAHPGAEVESVRGGAVRPQEPLPLEGTPNRDSLVVQDQRAAYDALNRRWCRP
jgi:HK97 family phage prohead protease